MKPQDLHPFTCSEHKKQRRKWVGSSAVMTVQCARCTGGNSLCELLAPEEAPETVPDLDIFPKARRESPCVVDEIWHSSIRTFCEENLCIDANLPAATGANSGRRWRDGGGGARVELQGKCLRKYQDWNHLKGKRSYTHCCCDAPGSTHCLAQIESSRFVLKHHELPTQHMPAVHAVLNVDIPSFEDWQSRAHFEAPSGVASASSAVPSAPAESLAKYFEVSTSNMGQHCKAAIFRLEQKPFPGYLHSRQSLHYLQWRRFLGWPGKHGRYTWGGNAEVCDELWRRWRYSQTYGNRSTL